MKERVFKFGMIGGSGYALALLECLQGFIGRGECRLVAAAVLPREQGGEPIVHIKSQGTQIFDNWEEMLEATRGELDMCIIPTGIAQHRPMATRALELGHKVFLEKPLAGCFEDAVAIVALAQKYGDALSVGYQDIYQPSVQGIRELMRNGTLGTIRSIRGYGLWRRDSGYYARNGWAGRVRVGDDWVLDSPFNNALAHYLNLTLYLASPHDHAVARFDSVEAELYRARDIENFDTGSIRIHTESGFPIEFSVTHSCREMKGPFICIEGDKGRIEWEAFKHYDLHTAEGIRRVELENNQLMRVNMFRELMHWLDGMPSQRCSAVQALGQSLCVNMLYLLGPVPLVPQNLLAADSPEGSPVIEGIDVLFEQCFRKGGLPSEHGAPWGTGVRKISTPQEWAAALEQATEAGALSL